MHVEKCGRLWQVCPAHARSFLQHFYLSGFTSLPSLFSGALSHIIEMTHHPRVTQEQMTMLSKLPVEISEGVPCQYNVTHYPWWNATQNYGITHMHPKGTMFSEKKHFTFCLKKLLQWCLIWNFSVSKVHITQTQIQLTTEAPTWYSKHLIPGTRIRALLNSKWLKTSHISRVNVSALLNWNINTSKKQQGVDYWSDICEVRRWDFTVPKMQTLHLLNFKWSFNKGCKGKMTLHNLPMSFLKFSCEEVNAYSSSLHLRFQVFD